MRITSQYLKVQKLIKERERKSISDSLVEKKSELNNKLEGEIYNFYIIYVLIFILITILVFIVLHRIKLAKKEIVSLQSKVTLLQNPKNI